jgi:hypothetical protein
MQLFCPIPHSFGAGGDQDNGSSQLLVQGSNQVGPCCLNHAQRLSTPDAERLLSRSSTDGVDQLPEGRRFLDQGQEPG